MAYEQGIDRAQPLLLPESLDDYVSQSNPVRVIDAFVESLELHELDMDCKEPGTVGRDGYDPRALLKLYMYGYLNRIRSSRRLEQETKRNLEVIWLMRKLQPDHWTINEFRRRHAKAFKKLLKKFNLLCLKMGLFGGELVALDGSFIKAVNSKTRNYTSKQLKEVVERIEQTIRDYLEKLSSDFDEDGSGGRGGQNSDEATAQALAALEQKRGKWQDRLDEAEASENKQVSLSDPDSRRLNKRNQKTVGYNAQVAVDGQHHLIAAAELTQDGNDLRQLEPMSRAAKEELGVERLKVLGDTGYHNLLQIHQCEEQGIEVHSPARAPRASEKDFYPVRAFHYDAEQDCYRCPNGQQLTRHADDKQGEVIYRIYYNSAACRDCSLRKECTKAKYRKLHIHQYAEVGEKVATRLKEEPEIYARRKGLVEHVFGTIKWDWQQGALMTRGLVSTRGEWMLSCLAYNLRRSLNLLGVERLLEALGEPRSATLRKL